MTFNTLRVKAHDTGTEPIALRASQLEAITEEQLGPQDPDISPGTVGVHYLIATVIYYN